MLLLRPINLYDLQALERLAVISGGSMTTLPANRDHLNELINSTVKSLHKDVEQAGQESYHFVLEDSETQQVIGVSGIDATVGLSTPFYSYRIEDMIHASTELQIHNRVPALNLCQDYTGASRLCTLFLDQDHRNEQNLNLLSRARMLFIAQHPQRFASRLIAEIQGIADENNQSPFWECLGRHFFNMDFNKANYLTGINSKGFIADLMPHYPVYVPLLSQQAQDALGQVRPDLTQVKELLENEGFSYRGYVDIFDAGPTLEARTNALRSIELSRTAQLQISDQPSDDESCPVLIANNSLTEFRCALVETNPQAPSLTEQQAALLNLTDGESVTLLKL